MDRMAFSWGMLPQAMTQTSARIKAQPVLAGLCWLGFD